MADSATELSGIAAKRYRITGSLGAGGMGEVFRGEHIQLGRSVAIKRLKKELAVDQSVLKRFENEARAVNLIRHENIVEVTDFFKDDQGRVHMVMELLEGRSLGNLIRAMAPLPPSRVAHIGKQMAEALAAAHEVGIIHRDLKPENVFLIHRTSTEDYVKLLDFGIARLHRDCGGLESTESGIVMGTPNYMPPEQAKGGVISEAADTYSLGIILYEMLSGECPFPRTSAIEMMMAHIADPPRPLNTEGVPLGFRKLVESCLAKEPSERPKSMLNIALVLEEWAEITKPLSSVGGKSPEQSFANHETQPSISGPIPTNSEELASEQTWDQSAIAEADSIVPTSGVDFSSDVEKPSHMRGKSVVLIATFIAVTAAILFFVVRGRPQDEVVNREEPESTEPAVVSPQAREELDSLLYSMGLPPTPEHCKSTDETELAVHLIAARLLQRGKPGVARAQDTLAINELFRLDSNISPETNLWKARAYLLQGDSEAAKEYAGKAANGCSELAAAYGIEGTALALAGNHPAAIESLKRALAIDETYTDARFNLALSQQASRQTDAAIRSLSEVLVRRPEFVSARSLRGKIFLQNGDVPRALADLEQAVREEIDNANVWYALGFARKKSGSASAAVEAFCTAKQLGHATAPCEKPNGPHALPIRSTEWESDL